jgi:hypothetical protein
MEMGDQRHDQAALLPGKKHGAHCKIEWNCLTTCPDGCAKSRPYRDLISGSSSPYPYLTYSMEQSPS